MAFRTSVRDETNNKTLQRRIDTSNYKEKKEELLFMFLKGELVATDKVLK